MLKATFCFLLLMFLSTVVADKNVLSEQLSGTKPITAFSANYKLFHESDSVGKAIRKLEYLDNGTLKYSYNTKANWLIFSDKREEYSILNIEQDKVSPSYYSFNRKGTGKKKKYEWVYDQQNKTAIDVKNVTEMKIDFPERFQDKLSYHLQLRIDLMKNPQLKQVSFPVIDTSGRLKDYVYEYDSEEVLTLPYGTVTAIKLKREVKDKRRTTYAWFAPELDYLLVKLSQHRKGKEEFDIQLTSVDSTEI